MIASERERERARERELQSNLLIFPDFISRETAVGTVVLTLEIQLRRVNNYNFAPLIL
jgi:hypothetical protein